MANIDVSELMYDPDFVDPITVQRTAVTVGTNGRTQKTVTMLTKWNGNKPILGSIQPASGRALLILPEEQRVNGMMEIWTAFPLQDVTQNADPDIVIWKGQSYVVTKMDPWTNYGRGFRHGLLTLKALVANVG